MLLKNVLEFGRKRENTDSMNVLLSSSLITILQVRQMPNKEKEGNPLICHYYARLIHYFPFISTLSSLVRCHNQ